MGGGGPPQSRRLDPVVPERRLTSVAIRATTRVRAMAVLLIAMPSPTAEES